MRAPASYTGTAVVWGSVAKMARRLDPQRWHLAFPTIWNESYYTQPIYFVEPALPGKKKQRSVGRGRKMVRPPAVVPRSVVPPRLPNANQKTATPPGGQVPQLRLVPPPPEAPFYEDVIFAGYRYRNLLTVSYKSTSRQASYQYSQNGCLNVRRDPTDIDGGIDVDCGSAVVKAKGSSKVEVTINKMVRFTEPSNLTSDLNDIAHVFVPLSLDSWLHTLIFTT